MHLPFRREYSFPGLLGRSGRALRFDFAVFDDDGSILYLLEFQGRQHYVAVDRFGGYAGLRRQQANDRKKRQFCISRGIKLVTIPYYDEDRIDAEYLYDKIRG